MKILSISGTRSIATFETDEGVYYGQGEILSRGFMVYKDGLTDSNNCVVSSEKRDEIIEAIAKYLYGKPNASPFFFEN